MGRRQAPDVPDRLILDAGALIALARGDVQTRAFIERLLLDEVIVEVPAPVLAQVHRGGRERAKTDRALRWIDRYVPTSERTARDAGELLARSGLSDAIDAIVAAEALVGTPAVILTSDAEDIGRLVDANEAGRPVHVEVVES